MRQIVNKPFILCGAVILVMLALVVPAAATFQFQQSELNPSKIPLEAKTQQSVTAIIAIIPQGATTFIIGNQLQLTTGLTAPQWDVQVMVNGIPAAVIPAKGNTAFINGFLLSYPTSDDVTVSASVTGMVPSGVSSIILLQAVQQNNAGVTVPGSTQTISAPVAVPETPVPVLTSPSSSPVPGTATPAPTRAPGINPFILTGGLIVVAIVAWMLKKE